MPFGMLNGVGQGIGVLDGVLIVKGEWAVLGVNLGHSIVTNGNFATWLFPNYFGQNLFSFLTGQVSLPCNILLHIQLLYSLPFITNCLNLLHPIRILASTVASARYL